VVSTVIGKMYLTETPDSLALSMQAKLLFTNTLGYTIYSEAQLLYVGMDAW
jgi:hypothetical protein